MREGVQARHNVWLQRALEGTVWQSGCTSWFLDKHGDNKAIWPGFTFRYVMKTRRAKARDFHFARAGGEQAQP